MCVTCFISVYLIIWVPMLDLFCTMPLPKVNCLFQIRKRSKAYDITCIQLTNALNQITQYMNGCCTDINIVIVESLALLPTVVAVLMIVVSMSLICSLIAFREAPILLA